MAAAPGVSEYHPTFEFIVNVPPLPVLVNPDWLTPAIVCAAPLTLPAMVNWPVTVGANEFQSGSLSNPVDVLFMYITNVPPAFQKYLAWSADGNVTVCVHVMVQALLPVPVVVVLAELPVHVNTRAACDGALPRLVLMFVMSVATAASTLIV